MTTKTDTGSAFDALLAEVTTAATSNDTLAKAMAENAKVPNPNNLRKGDDGWQEGMEEPTDGGDDMGKAFTVKLPNGEETVAIDATDMLKALDSDMGALREKVIPAMLGVIKKQGEMLKAMNDQVTALRGAGTGRRSATLTVLDRAPLVEDKSKETADGMTPGAFMAKAMEAMLDGRITSHEGMELEALVGAGRQPPEAMVNKVLSAKR